MRFAFDARKAVEVMTYIVSQLKGRETDKVKLMKLVYLADRDHFLTRGRPITGDDQYAMQYGPVPSLCLDLLDGQFMDEDADLFRNLHTEDHKVSLKQTPEPVRLAGSEREALDRIITHYGEWGSWELVEHTHQFAEYKRVFREGTSTRIPFELLLEIYRPERFYRHNRPVITNEMAANMACPFPKSEDDM